MKKINLFLLLILMISKASFAQVDWGKYSQSYPAGTTDHKSQVGLIALIPMNQDMFWSNSEPSVLRNRLQADSVFAKIRPANFLAITTFDTTKAQFFIHGITPANAKGYEYRVMEGMDRMVVPWSPIDRFADTGVQRKSGMGVMAYAGGFSASYGRAIIVDVRNKSSKRIITSALVKWVSIRPILVDVYTASQFNDFMARLNHAWTIKKDVKPLWLNPATGLPEKMVFKPTDNNLVFYLKSDVYDRKLIEYELLKENDRFRNWRKNDFDNSFVWLRDLPPGDYLLKIRYSFQRENVATYAFQINAPWYQSTKFYIVLTVLKIAFVGFAVFLTLYIVQKRKATRELSKKTKLQLELQAIHAQLNPHFVFNALNSIQGLINKNDITGANRYLGDFATLLRNSLSDNNREQIPLTEEIKALETYLKLEQLRFSFEYEISIGSNINVYETEMPSLLLQPLIENAIKHGIATLKEAGKIILMITKNKEDMMITLKDNGSGFALGENTAGLGLKLTCDRIKLLNEMMKGESINLEINSSPGQPTIVHLIFKNWFNEN